MPGGARLAGVMAEIENVLLLAGDALLYFVVLAALLRARTRIGLGAFFTALGVMHFLETYLPAYSTCHCCSASSPLGSTVLFTGKLMMLLLLYPRRRVAVRQPIYGLCSAMSRCLRRFRHAAPQSGSVDAGPRGRFRVLNEMGALMVWERRSCSSTASS